MVHYQRFVAQHEVLVGLAADEELEEHSNLWEYVDNTYNATCAIINRKLAKLQQSLPDGTDGGGKGAAEQSNAVGNRMDTPQLAGVPRYLRDPGTLHGFPGSLQIRQITASNRSHQGPVGRRNVFWRLRGSMEGAEKLF